MCASADSSKRGRRSTKHAPCWLRSTATSLPARPRGASPFWTLSRVPMKSSAGASLRRNSTLLPPGPSYEHASGPAAISAISASCISVAFTRFRATTGPLTNIGRCCAAVLQRTDCHLFHPCPSILQGLFDRLRDYGMPKETSSRKGGPYDFSEETKACSIRRIDGITEHRVCQQPGGQIRALRFERRRL